MVHIGLDDRHGAGIAQGQQYVDPEDIGGDLCAQVTHAFGDVARGPGAIFESLAECCFAKDAAGDEEEVVETDSLFVDGAGEGRHGSGCDTTNVGMVPPIGDEENTRAIR